LSDPAEQRAHEGSVAKTRIFRRYVEHAIGPTAEEPGTGELDPGTVAQLKALGYLRYPAAGSRPRLESRRFAQEGAACATIRGARS